MIQQIVLFDRKENHTNLFPITMTRSAGECLVGIDTIEDKWKRRLNLPIFIQSVDYLKPLYKAAQEADQTLFVAANLVPDDNFMEEIKKLTPGEGYKKDDAVLCYISKNLDAQNIKFKSYPHEVISLEFPWDIFKLNGLVMEEDFEQITKGRHSADPDRTNTLIGPQNKLFIEPGAKVRACILNTEEGCIYIGKDAEIMEGSVIRGPFALGEHGVVKLASKVYGPTTVGAYSKIGGEVNNSVIFAYSNKGHDGFLGNSVLGQWCNLGADTNNSNLKNNYGIVKAYNYLQKKEITTGLQFCGLIMGDHSKSGINTMFNTGTVCGVSSNIYGGGFPSKNIRNFSWGGAEKIETYQFEKAIETANRMMERRGKKISEEEKKVLFHLMQMPNE